MSVPADAPAPPSAGLLVAIAPPPPPPAAQAPAPRAARDAPSAVSRKAPDRPAAPVASDSGYASQLTAGVNAERSRAGLAPLGPSSCAQRYAQRWAEHLASTGAFGHQSLGPVLSGCGAAQVAENLARGPGSPSTLVAAWMASSGHRANILDASLTVAGMAAVQGANGNWTAVQVFLTP